MSRETHIMVEGNISDENWRDLLKAVRVDFGRVGKEKGAVFKSLERWVRFPNRFIEVANICAELYDAVLEYKEGFTAYKAPALKNVRQARNYKKAIAFLSERSAKLHQPCLELSLLTPVMAETFINMIILILCKQEVRRNQRQFEAFIRSNIDIKLFDLFLKCDGFVRPIDASSEKYKSFKRVMDKRNDAIHGNANPIEEQLEMVYFEGKVPLFKEASDNIGKFFEALERQYKPDAVIKDYLDVHHFLLEIVSHLQPDIVKDFWMGMDDNYPGYDLDRLITGRLFPENIVAGRMRGIRYDDELAVVWD